MFGHNHNSWGYDDYLGTGSVYLTKGDNIYIAKPENQTALPTEYTLAFTYMNAGYVGYNYSETAGADKTLTMTVFEIRDDLVTVERYSASGLHNMKSRGLWADTSHRVESKENYGADDSYIQKEYKSPQAIVGDIGEDVNVRVLSSKLTGLTVDERTSGKNDVVHVAYTSYDVATTGYVKGNNAIVHVTLPEDSDFDLSKPVFVIEKETGTVRSCNISNRQVKFETTYLGDFELVQFKAVSSVVTEKTLYRLVSSGNYTTDSNDYLIVSSNATGSAFMMKDNGDGTTLAVDVEILSDGTGKYIASADDSCVWKWIKTTSIGGGTGLGDMQNVSTGRYLYGKAGELPITIATADSDYTYWKLSGSGYFYSLTNTTDQTRNYLKADNGFSMVSQNSSSYYTYLFEESITYKENAIYIDSTEGRVKENADLSNTIGSKIVFSYEDGTLEAVDVTLSMLRDKEGNEVNTDVIGKQNGLQVYYEDTLIYDGYTLQVCHENGFNYLDVSNYRSGDVFAYPEERGYVFAGWYEDATFKKTLGKDEKVLDKRN